MNKILRAALEINVAKTIYFNFKMLPFHQAIKLPIAIAWRTCIDKCQRGTLIVPDESKTFSILLGFGGSRDLAKFNSRKNYLSLRSGSKVIFKGSARFSPHYSLLASDSIIVFGDKFSCNNSCSFSASGAGITFGRNCLVGGDVVVRDTDGHSIWKLDESGKREEEQPSTSPVIIGDRVWLCTRSTILKGSQIGNGCVVAYNALCTRIIKDNNCIIAGQPAKIVKRNIEWEL